MFLVFLSFFSLFLSLLPLDSCQILLQITHFLTGLNAYLGLLWVLPCHLDHKFFSLNLGAPLFSPFQLAWEAVSRTLSSHWTAIILSLASGLRPIGQVRETLPIAIKKPGVLRTWEWWSEVNTFPWERDLGEAVGSRECGRRGVSGSVPRVQGSMRKPHFQEAGCLARGHPCLQSGLPLQLAFQQVKASLHISRGVTKTFEPFGWLHVIWQCYIGLLQPAFGGPFHPWPPKSYSFKLAFGSLPSLANQSGDKPEIRFPRVLKCFSPVLSPTN